MQAIIAIGVIGTVLEEYANFMLAGHDDPAVSILEIRGLGDKLFGYSGYPQKQAISRPYKVPSAELIAQTTRARPANSVRCIAALQRSASLGPPQWAGCLFSGRPAGGIPTAVG